MLVRCDVHLAIDAREQHTLGLEVSQPNLLIRNAQRIARTETILPPARNVAVKKGANGCDVHVGAYTPFVIESMLYSPNMCRDTSPCLFATPLM